MFTVSTKTKDNIRLSDEGKSEYKRYWKQLCPFGEWIDPNDWDNSKLVIDKNLVDQLVKNFNDGVLDYVPVPLGHPYDSSSLASLNTGELLELEAREDGLYGLIEIRDNAIADKIDKNLIPNVSMGMDLQYKDKKDGSLKGAVLQHVGLVTDPYLKGMHAFEPALSDMSQAAIVLSDSSNNKREENGMNKVTVTNDRDFDVDVKWQEDGEEKTATVVAGADVEVPEDQEEAVKQQIADAKEPEDKDEDKSGEDNLSEGEKDLSDEQKALEAEKAELAREKAELAKQKRELSEKQAEAEYEKLLSEGKLVPAQKESYLALCAAKDTKVQLSDKKTKSVDVLLSELFAAMPAMRLLSEDGGEGGNGNGDEVQLDDSDKADIERFGLNEEDYKEVKREKEKQ